MRTVALPFTPRDWQRPLLDDPAPRVVAVVHRRAGKSTALMWRGLRKAATWRRPHLPEAKRNLTADPPRVVHVLPERVQWSRTGLWDRLATAAAAIPGAEVLKSELAIRLPGGRVYQAGGMDNPDSWRGGYADEVIEDEADDVTAGGLDMVVEPMLADYGGVRLYAGTPKGNGRLQAHYDRAGHEAGWSRYLLTYRDTGVLADDAIGRLRMQLTPEEFAQELECSFTAPNSGAYYARYLDDAERQGRIRAVPWEPRLPVITAWDLGMLDATAIWFLQLLPGSGEVRALRYIEASGEDLAYYARELAGTGYVFGQHHLPHDAAVRELGTGRSRKEILEGLGVRPIHVGANLPLADGINATMALLPRMWWDAEGTALGRKHLRAYRRVWIEERGVWSSKPEHNAASHAADALRTFAVNYREPPTPMQAERSARERALAAVEPGYDPFRW